MAQEGSRLPLAGLRILEIGHYVAAPFATRLLGDLGAEIIKIEPPAGDPLRGWGSAVEGHGVWFSVHGRNKRSVVLDLKKLEDRARLLAIAARCDGLVENMRPGQLEKLGVGPAELQAANPRLIITRISGYGQDGPYRDKPSFGAIGEAMGGLRHLTGHPRSAQSHAGPQAAENDLPPPRCGISISDDLAGMYAALSLVSALWGRDRAGATPEAAAGGRVIDIDLVSSVFSLMEGMLPEYGLFGRIRQPQGAAIATAAPTNTYPCADGKWLCIAGNSDLIFRRLMRAIGQEALGEAPRFATNALRCANVAELDALIAAWTRTQPAATAQEILDAAEVPCSRLYDIQDCAEDPHFQARQMVLPVQDPLIGEVLHPAPPFRFDGVAPAEMVRWTGPATGADTKTVLEELLGEENALGEEKAS